VAYPAELNFFFERASMKFWLTLAKRKFWAWPGKLKFHEHQPLKNFEFRRVKSKFNIGFTVLISRGKRKKKNQKNQRKGLELAGTVSHFLCNRLHQFQKFSSTIGVTIKVGGPGSSG